MKKSLFSLSLLFLTYASYAQQPYATVNNNTPYPLGFSLYGDNALPTSCFSPFKTPSLYFIGPSGTQNLDVATESWEGGTPVPSPNIFNRLELVFMPIPSGIVTSLCTSSGFPTPFTFPLGGPTVWITVKNTGSAYIIDINP